MEERRPYYAAFFGLCFLLTVRGLLAVSVSGETEDGQDHNVMFLDGISDLRNVEIPKDSDIIPSIVDDRTSASVNNSDSEISDSYNYAIADESEEGEEGEVPTTVSNTQVSGTTNTAESSDERPATATTLTATSGDADGSIVATDGNNTSLEGGITTMTNDVTDDVAIDVTTVSDIAEVLMTDFQVVVSVDVPTDVSNDVGDSQDVMTPVVIDIVSDDSIGILSDNTNGTLIEDFFETVSVDSVDTVSDDSVDTDSVDSPTTSYGCRTDEEECGLSPAEPFEATDSPYTVSAVDIINGPITQLGYLNASVVASGSLLETSPVFSEGKGSLEALTTQDHVAGESEMLVSPPSLAFVDPITTTVELENLVTENHVPATETILDGDSEGIGDSEVPQRSVTDTGDSNMMSGDDDDYDLIVETLISTATLYYDEESLQNLETSRRVVRTVSQDLYATPLDAYNHDVSNQYRGFLSEDPASIKTFMTVSSEGAFDLRRKSQRKSDPEPDIDDIIKGIVQLLGGNVKVTAAEEIDTRLTTFGNYPQSSRINNRGPPRVTQGPFGLLGGVLSSAILTRPPIRPPITPPASIPNIQPIPGLPPGRPQFVANTRPPFLAPLPPSLASRPSPPIQRPYATGVPLPVDNLPELVDSDDRTSVIPVNPVFPDYGNQDGGILTTEDHPPLEMSTNLVTNSQPFEIPSSVFEETLVETTTTLIGSSSTATEEITTTLIGLSSTATEEVPTMLKETDLPTAIEVVPTTSKETELSTQNFASAALVPTTVSSIPVTETSTKNHLEPSVLEPSSVLITPTPVEEGEPQQTSTIATVVISSSQELSSSTESTSINAQLSSSATPPLQRPSSAISTQQFPVLQSSSTRLPAPSLSRPRPGVVLDDSDYRPGQIITGTVVPYDTGRPGDIFDVTVSAYQDFGGGGSRPIAKPPRNPDLGHPYVIPVDPQGGGIVNGNGPLITTPAGGNDGFVSIDGRKTYFDLFPTATQSQGLTQDQTVGTGVGIVIPEEEISSPVGQGGHGGFYQVKPIQPPEGPSRPLPTQPPAPAPPSTQSRPPSGASPARQPSFNRRPTQPPIRIDTCIVGDDSTCQEQLSEVCRTEGGVSSCYCKPGTARRRPRTPCKRMVTLRVSMKVDRVGDQRIMWSGNYGNPESEEYRLLEWESHRAISNAMSKTRLSSSYLGNIIHKFYSIGGKVIVNSTIQLEDSSTTRNRNIPQMVQRQLIQVIQNHANNIGDSALYVDGPHNPIPDVSDVNECNDATLYDCHVDATCINEFGTFTCRCLPGYTDRFSDDPEQVGRKCESCSSDYCNKRGDCRIESGHKVCECMGSYYGTRCEIDGEVLGVAVGASVAAVVIIILTLIFLCMWSRRWKAQDRKTEVLARGAAAAGAGGTLGGFSVNIQHKGNTLTPSQYGVSMEDRMRWAQIAESIGTQNIYAHQPQDMGGAAVYSANSNEYLTSAAATPNPFSVYNRVTRALSHSTLGRRGGRGVLDRLRGIFGRQTKAPHTSSKNRFPMMTTTASSHPTLNFQQLMALHAHLSAQPEHIRGTMGGPSGPPTIAGAAPTTLFKNQRQMAASSSGYASLGTLGSTAAGNFTHQPHEQYGLQHLNPVGHLTSLQHQQQQLLYQKQQQAFGAQSTYGQYGPASFTAMSQSGLGDGVSRAPTLGARTPVPLHESMGGAATIGPMGGASVVAAKGMGSRAPTSMGGMMMESSEEEMDRGPYHLPRPKSRGSLAGSSDIYYEPDDLTTTSGPPDRPPPPIPRNSHPQTYNFSFLH